MENFFWCGLVPAWAAHRTFGFVHVIHCMEHTVSVVWGERSGSAWCECRCQVYHV